LQNFSPEQYPNLAKLDKKVQKLLKSREAKEWSTARKDYEISKIHPVYWMEEHGWIKAGLLEGGVQEVGIIPFTLNTVQLQIADRICAHLITEPWERVQTIILKHRKAGISTLIAAFDYWFMRFISNLNAFLIADLASHTDNIASMVALFQERDTCGVGCEDTSLHPPEKVPIPGSKKGLKLGNGSMLELDTGENSNPGTSGTVIVAHMSENAKWRDPINSETSLLNSIPRTGFVFIIKESTAFGLNKYSEDCGLAERGESSWDFIFLLWTDDHTCQIPLKLGEEIKHNEEEKELVIQYRLSDEQIKFRRDKIGQLGSVQRFRQDFPLNSREPFLVTGSNYFDVERIQERVDEINFYRDWKVYGWDYVAKHYSDMVAKYSHHPRGVREALNALEMRNVLPQMVNVTINKGRVTFSKTHLTTEQGAATMFVPPQRGRRYLIIIDPAEGIKTSEYVSDNAIIEVLDTFRREQVMEWGDVFDEDVTAIYAVMIAKLYNSAPIAFDRKNRCGALVERNLRDSGYRNIFYEQRIVNQIIKRQIGFEITRGNKKDICGQLKQDFKNGDCRIHSIEALGEMAYFIDNNGILGASSGHTDDKLMGLASGMKIIADTPEYRQPKKKIIPSAHPMQSVNFAAEQRRLKKKQVLQKYM
jgi:hypothetical protein